MKKQLSIFKKISIMFVLAVMLASFMSTAQAILMKEDLSAPGDGLLTYDSSTGLEWLNVTLTLNYSYNDVMAGSGGYTTILGFRYATANDLIQLFNDVGISPSNGSYDPFGFQQVNTLMYQFLGLTSANYNSRAISALYEDPSFSVLGEHQAAGLYTNDYGQWVVVLGGIVQNTTRGGSSFLVRDSAPLPSTIPEPSQILLFGAGLAGLLGTRLRSKKLFV
jgi:hypothetical protein